MSGEGHLPQDRTGWRTAASHRVRDPPWDSVFEPSTVGDPSVLTGRTGAPSQMIGLLRGRRWANPLGSGCCGCDRGGELADEGRRLVDGIVTTPGGAVEYIVRTQVPAEVREEVRDALPVLLSPDFSEAARRIRRAATPLPPT
jgi:hypothetical protein